MLAQGVYTTHTTMGEQLLNAAVITVGFAFPHPQPLTGKTW